MSENRGATCTARRISSRYALHVLESVTNYIWSRLFFYFRCPFERRGVLQVLSLYLSCTPINLRYLYDPWHRLPLLSLYLPAYTQLLPHQKFSSRRCFEWHAVALSRRLAEGKSCYSASDKWLLCWESVFRRNHYKQSKCSAKRYFGEKCFYTNIRHVPCYLTRL